MTGDLPSGAPAAATEQPLDPGAVRFGPDGLIAAVVQDASDGRVLMVAWQDREALEATLSTGDVHFHSRSRGTLWRKGETSGNVLRLRRAELDCDADAILLTVDPAGPTCHTGARSCFDVGASTDGDGSSSQAPSSPTEGTTATDGFAWLDTLWVTIQQRAADRPEGSYTARLIYGGVDAAARKVAEEAVEVVMAAKDHAVAAGDAPTTQALTGELADLLYHTLVLMAERNVQPASVMRVLRDRARASAPQTRG